MDFYRFINSKDIRKYHKKKGIRYNALEAAWLVARCNSVGVYEKHTAWKWIIDNMPDYVIADQNESSADELKIMNFRCAAPKIYHGWSVHETLKEYMALQNDFIKKFQSDEEGSLFVCGQTLEGGLTVTLSQPIFSSWDNCIEYALFEYKSRECDGIVIEKRMLDVKEEFEWEKYGQIELTPDGEISQIYIPLSEDSWELKAFFMNICIYLDLPVPFQDVASTLAKCGFSEEMVTHLVEGKSISKYELVDIICQAPVALDEKIGMLRGLEDQENGEDEEYITELRHAIGEARVAMRDIRACEYEESNQKLYLFSEWYDTDSFVEKSHGVGLFSTEEEVKNNINCEYYSEDETDEGIEKELGIEDDTEAENDGELWSRAELWDLLDSKWEYSRFDFYFMGDKICWFEKLYPEIQENGNIYYTSWGDRDFRRQNKRSRRRFMSGGVDLNLSTPYKPGEIVSIDCRPFGPPFHAMILEGRDQWDCCFPTIVFKVPYTNKWRLTSLKHKRFYYDAEINAYEPMLSPLFRIRKVKEAELTDDDMELKQLSELLEGSEEKASAIWETWTGLDLEDIEFRKVQEILVEESKKMRVE